MILSKRGLWIFIVSILAIMGSYSVLAQFSETTDCANSKTLFKISNSEGGLKNAHVELYNSQGSYPNKVCYTGTAITTSSRACNADNVILRLNSNTNAHAQTAEYTDYTNNVCYNDLRCRAVEGNCVGVSKCVVKLSSTTDAHLSDCSETDFHITLCCNDANQPVEGTSPDDLPQVGLSDGSSCTSSNECASRSCINRRCVRPGGTYSGDEGEGETQGERLPDGSSCTSSNQCASRSCINRRCVRPGGVYPGDEGEGGGSQPEVCSQDSDCGEGEACSSGNCIRGRQCTQNSDCNQGQVCNVLSGTCGQPGCTTNSDCSSGKTCNQGNCQDCERDTDADGANDCVDSCPTIPYSCDASNTPTCSKLGGVDCTGGVCLPDKSDSYENTRSIKCCMPFRGYEDEVICASQEQYLIPLGSVITFQKSACVDEDGDGEGVITVEPKKEGGFSVEDAEVLYAFGLGLKHKLVARFVACKTSI